MVDRETTYAYKCLVLWYAEFIILHIKLIYLLLYLLLLLITIFIFLFYTVQYNINIMWLNLLCRGKLHLVIFLWISLAEKQYLLPVNFRRLSIKFYISGINFVFLIQLDYKLLQSKFETSRQFLFTYIGPCHIRIIMKFIICYWIWKNQPNCHILYFKKYHFEILIKAAVVLLCCIIALQDLLYKYVEQTYS